ncbi:response regulator [Brucepastera parasyntrophica]|uniref:response regulator transcription factor n=1 Tax=Brucepastera parasyntrophica TaxID=2880008 RepID=UPI002109B345|nr:response regulator [Brucepastera parasyntrophica]ULQ60860.1 response regulator [Brucepastera parasyntrophica]
MYKVLLSDDEQIVIDSLRYILERNFPEQVEFYFARSGGEAVEVCQTEKIDVLFIDIHMPGLNGIEAIKAIKNFSPALVIIVLTAFDRFDYAQQAINLGVYEYLSKPVNRNRIIETMRNAMQSVDTVRRKRVSEIQIREKLDSVINIVESDFIYSLIFPSEKNCDIEAYFDFFDIQNSFFYFMVMEVYDIMQQDRAGLYTTIRSVLSASETCITGPLVQNRIVIFVPLSGTQDPTAEQYDAIRQTVNLIYSRITAHSGVRLKIAVSTIEQDFSRSFSLYNETLRSLVNSGTSDGIVFCNDITETDIVSDTYFSGPEKKLFDRATAGDIQAVHTLVSSVFQQLEKQYPGAIDIQKGKLFEILAVIRFQTRQMYPDFGGFSDWKNTYSDIEKIPDSGELLKYIMRGIDECLMVINEHKKNRMSPLISQACKIITEHLAHDISQEEISRRLKISPFYFSKLFKEETGENFIDYVTAARMQKAKEMLRERSYSIKEISAETGYSDPNYFSKIFKKNVGITPTEYRETL